MATIVRRLFHASEWTKISLTYSGPGTVTVGTSSGIGGSDGFPFDYLFDDKLELYLGPGEELWVRAPDSAAGGALSIVEHRLPLLRGKAA